MTNHPVFHPDLHMSELISGFIIVLGGLIIWTMINKKENLFSSNIIKRTVAGVGIAIMAIIAGTAGLVVHGHGWGNPTSAMGLAMQQPWKVFTNHENLMLLGIVYIAFELLGAILGIGAFMLFVWMYNFAQTKKTEEILLSKIFKFSDTPMLEGAAKDIVGTIIFIFMILGASNFGKEPGAFTNSDTTTLGLILLPAIALGGLVLLFGTRMILTLNPLIWLGAFVMKFVTAFYLDRKSITLKAVGREIAMPLTSVVVAVAAGLGVSGILTWQANW